MASLGLGSRDRRIAAAARRFVLTMLEEPGPADVAWVARDATGGDRDHAAWELRYAMRALSIIAAELNALNDATSSLITREAAAVFARDPRVDPTKLQVAERQFNARLSGYRDALAAKGTGAPLPLRLGRTFMAFAGRPLARAGDATAQVGGLLDAYLGRSETALRECFGPVWLPEGVPPSTMAPGRTRRPPRM